MAGDFRIFSIFSNILDTSEKSQFSTPALKPQVQKGLTNIHLNQIKTSKQLLIK